MNLRSDQLMMASIIIIFGGLISILYLANKFGIDLPGYTILLPILTGGGLLIYSIRLPDYIPQKESTK